MTIKFPKSTVVHRRKPDQEAEPVFLCQCGVVGYKEALKIYYATQLFFYREDVRNYINDMWVNDELTKEQYADLLANIASIAEEYRDRLSGSDSVLEGEKRTLDFVLEGYIN